MSGDKRWQLRIEHILDAIEKIQRYTAGLTEATFAAHSMAVDAVIRNFQIMGEAVRRVPRRCAGTLSGSAVVRSTQGMRHILVHDYFTVKLARYGSWIEAVTSPRLVTAYPQEEGA